MGFARSEHWWCRYHCRGCGSHFTSLRAFDYHLEGKEGRRRCGDPERPMPGGPLLIGEGRCAISDPPNIAKNVVLYSIPDGPSLRAYHEARESVGVTARGGIDG